MLVAVTPGSIVSILSLSVSWEMRHESLIVPLMVESESLTESLSAFVFALTVDAECSLLELSFANTAWGLLVLLLLFFLLDRAVNAPHAMSGVAVGGLLWLLCGVVHCVMQWAIKLSNCIKSSRSEVKHHGQFTQTLMINQTAHGRLELQNQWCNRRFQLSVDALSSHAGTPSLVHWLALADPLPFLTPASHGVMSIGMSQEVPV